MYWVQNYEFYAKQENICAIICIYRDFAFVYSRQVFATGYKHLCHGAQTFTARAANDYARRRKPVRTD